MNITEEIERSIGGGPPLPSPTARLAAGKSAVRRRRIAAGAAALAAVVMLGGTFSAIGLLDRDAKSDPDQVVVVPNPDVPIDAAALQPGHIVGYDEDGRLVRDAGVRVTKLAKNPVDLDGAANALLEIEYQGRTSWVHVYQNPGGSDYRDDDAESGTFEAWADRLPREYGPDDWREPAWYEQGRIHLGPGARELKRIDNPMGPDQESFGLVVEQAGVTYWLEVDGGGGATEIAAESDFPTFEMWLDDYVAMQKGQQQLALVRFDANHKLVAREGVTIVRQSADPEVDGVVPHPDDLAAVAEVRYQGRTWFVMARQIRGEGPEYFPTVAKPGRATMAEYLAHARIEYGPVMEPR